MAAAGSMRDFTPNIDPVTGLPVMAVPTMPGAPMIPGMTGLPAYPGIAGLNELFSPQFGRNEVLTTAAENAVGGGFGGGGFAGAQGMRLLDSERKANWALGHQILEPYLNREFEAGQGAANRQSRLNEIAAQGANALQQLQLSEAGETARLTQAQQAQLERDILQGQQAMQQLTLREAGDTSRQRIGIGGTLANTLLQGEIANRNRPGGPTVYGADNLSGPIGSTFYGSPGTGLASVQPGSTFSPMTSRTPAPAGGSGVDSLGLGSSSIDALLRRYGLL